MLTIVVLAWVGLLVLWVPCALCLSGRPAPAFSTTSIDSAAYTTLGDSALRLYGRAIDDFHTWLLEHNISTDVRTLALMPATMCRLLVLYGEHAYSTGLPLYLFVSTISAVEDAFPRLHKNLASPWKLVTKWRSLEPVTHRVPIPHIIYQALVVMAFLLGWTRFAGILVICFKGPARLMEALRALRGDLVFPTDMLAYSLQRLYLVVGALS